MTTLDVTRTTVCTLNLLTDQSGACPIEFSVPESLIGREQTSGDATISLAVTVCDSAGQRQSQYLSRVVAAQPIRIEVIPESGQLVRDVPNRIYLFTSYPDGQPAAARVAITGVEQELQTDKLGITELTVTPSAEPFVWTLRATDAAGLVGRRSVTLDSKQSSGDFLVRLDKAVYEGGGSLEMVVLGAGREPLFFDLLKDRQTVLSDRVEMVDGRGTRTLDLPIGLSGTIQLCAYRFNAAGLPIRKARAFYVRSASELQIQTRLDQAEYRPGERHPNLTVTDGQGSPAPGR